MALRSSLKVLLPRALALMLSLSRGALRRPSLLAALVLLTACRGSDTGRSPAGTTGGTGDTGGTMVVATPNDAGTLLPQFVATLTDRLVTDLLYDRLAEIGDDLQTVGDRGFTPQLAERWEWAPDSLSIAFHINPHARWHDGQPVRASDVRYSVALLKDPVLGSPVAPSVLNIDSASVRDSLTAVIWFAKRTPEQFYDATYQVLIVPEHVLANTPAAQLKTAEVGRRGIGSGRFRLVRWQPGQRLELVADTGNYRGRPRLDRVILAISPDFAGAATRFFSGDADMFEQLRPEQVAQVARDTARRAVAYGTLGYAFALMNNRAPGSAVPHPVFGDRMVRRALTMAVDRRALLRNVWDTLGRLAYGPFPRSLAVADTTIPQLPYDTARARALLDSAGWRPGPDGIRMKNGRRLAFGITTPSSSAVRHQYATLLQESFRRVGADATLDEADFGAVMQKVTTSRFDMTIMVYNTDPSLTGFRQSWSTAAIGAGGSNFGAYSNRVADAYLDSATTTFDPAREKSYARHFFETLVEDAPAIWLYDPALYAGLQRRIHPAPMRADGWWAHLAEWWIPAAQRTARDRIGLRPAP